MQLPLAKMPAVSYAQFLSKALQERCFGLLVRGLILTLNKLGTLAQPPAVYQALTEAL